MVSLKHFWMSGIESILHDSWTWSNWKRIWRLARKQAGESLHMNDIWWLSKACTTLEISNHILECQGFTWTFRLPESPLYNVLDSFINFCFWKIDLMIILWESPSTLVWSRNKNKTYTLNLMTKLLLVSLHPNLAELNVTQPASSL